MNEMRESLVVAPSARQLSVSERGDKIESVLRVFEVDFERLGPASFDYGVRAGSEDDDSLIEFILALIDNRFPHTQDEFNA